VQIVELLKSKGLLKPGWEKAWAMEEGITSQAIYNRIRSWKELDGEEPKANLLNLPIEYTNSNKELNFEESP
jgi:hypothetical protein